MGEGKKKDESLWMSIFIPNVRVLTENEIAELPKEKDREPRKPARKQRGRKYFA